MSKYIIFQAEPNAEGWENRKLEHTPTVSKWVKRVGVEITEQGLRRPASTSK